MGLSDNIDLVVDLGFKGFPDWAILDFKQFLNSLFSMGNADFYVTLHVLRGETLAEIARKRGVSRQAISQRLKMLQKKNPFIKRMFQTKGKTGVSTNMRFHRFER